ncbi:cyclin-dependent protein kinase inhibitor SMR10 [Andrographis paniculata]|uniref:cyclin-dependent protein kinase inhibitor SMR10 n=1 Tax=Andrographis paniculata TaxID=175694 RepID=UPI0021E8514A|nr:cyclin-dependent protein kinase inhibitor SMR10 [Andrographis paniculata]
MGLPKKMDSEEDRLLPDQKDLHQLTLQKCDEVKEVHNKGSSAVGGVLKMKMKMKMKVRIEERDDDGHGDGGCSTPRAVDKDDDVPLECPPTPRKPKSLPLPSMKRKFSDTALLDLSNEIVTLFPPTLLRDFLCGKIKKVRTDSLTHTIGSFE